MRKYPIIWSHKIMRLHKLSRKFRRYRLIFSTWMDPNHFHDFHSIMRVYFQLHDIKQILVGHIFDVNRYLPLTQWSFSPKSFLTITADASLEVSSSSITLGWTVSIPNQQWKIICYSPRILFQRYLPRAHFAMMKMEVTNISTFAKTTIPLRKKRERISGGNFTRKFNLSRKEEFR